MLKPARPVREAFLLFSFLAFTGLLLLSGCAHTSSTCAKGTDCSSTEIGDCSTRTRVCDSANPCTINGLDVTAGKACTTNGENTVCGADTYPPCRCHSTVDSTGQVASCTCQPHGF